MRKTNLIVLLLLIGTLLTAGSGCVSRIAKEGLGVARGAKGVYAPVRPLAAAKEARPLGRYRMFELGAITDDFGGNVPPDFLGHLRAAFEKQRAGKGLPNDPGGKTLLIRGRILHFETSGALGHAFGPFEEVLARIELVDKDSGQVLGTANCIGRSTTSGNVGVAKKGEGLAKAIISWVADRYPKPPRD